MAARPQRWRHRDSDGTAAAAAAARQQLRDRVGAGAAAAPTAASHRWRRGGADGLSEAAARQWRPRKCGDGVGVAAAPGVARRRRGFDGGGAFSSACRRGRLLRDRVRCPRGGSCGGARRVRTAIYHAIEAARSHGVRGPAARHHAAGDEAGDEEAEVRCDKGGGVGRSAEATAPSTTLEATHGRLSSTWVAGGGGGCRYRRADGDAVCVHGGGEGGFAIQRRLFGRRPPHACRDGGRAKPEQAATVGLAKATRAVNSATTMAYMSHG